MRNVVVCGVCVGRGYEAQRRKHCVLYESIADEAGKTTGVYLVVGSNLGEYDFEKKGFTTGIGEGVFVNFSKWVEY